MRKLPFLRPGALPLAGMLALLGMGTVAGTFFLLYQAEVQRERSRLRGFVEGQVHLMEAVARFDAIHSQEDHPGGALQATLEQIREAGLDPPAFARTGEVYLVALEGDSVAILVGRPRGSVGGGTGETPPELHAVLSRAAVGESGAEVLEVPGRGELLVAFEPVRTPGATLGLVALLSLRETLEPFRNRAGAALFLTLALALTLTPFVRLLAAPTQKRLEESERRYRRLFEGSGEPIVVTTPSGTILEANEAAVRSFGGTREDLLSRDAREFWDDPAKRDAILDRLREEGSVRGVEVRLRRADGTPAPYLASLALRPGEGGEEVRIEGILTDISRQKATEEVLARSRLALEEMGEIARVGRWELWLSGGGVDWDPVVHAIHGTTPGFVPTLDEALAFYETEDRKVLAAALEAALAEGEPYDLELRLVTRSGEERWVRTLGRPEMVDGRCVHLRGTIQDVTTRRRAEEELRASEERFRALFLEAPLPYQSLDTEGRFLAVNRALCDLVGRREEELLGHPFLEVLAPSSRKIHLEQFPRFKAEGAVSGVTMELERSDGELRMVAVEGRMGYDAEGNPERTHCILRDVTELRVAERARREAEEGYRLLFNGMREGFALHRMIWSDAGEPVDFLTLEVNPAFETVTGIASSRVVGKTARQYLPPSQHFWIRRYGEVVRTGVPASFHFHYPNLDRYFHSSVFRPKDGHFAVILSDETEQIRAERARAENEERLSLAQSVAEIGFIDRDLQRDLSYWSPSVYELLGLDPGEVPPTAETFFCRLPPEERDRMAARLEELKEGTTTAPTRFWVVHPSGERRCLQSRTRALPDASGRPVRVLAVLRDVTLEEVSREEREQNAERLQALLTLSLLEGSEEEELVDYALEAIVRLTRSQAGILRVHDPETGRILLDRCWSSGRTPTIPSQECPYAWESVDALSRTAAVRGPVIQQAAPEGSPPPDEHGERIPVHRSLVAPCREGGEIVLVAGVANKPTPYTELDATQLSLFLRNLWGLLRRTRMEEALRRSEESLRAFSTRLEEVREEERKALAREIHDELGQALTGIHMDMAAMATAPPADARELRSRMSRLLSLTDDGIDMVRRISTRLRPPVLDVMGLGPALRWMLEELEPKEGPAFHLDLPELGPALSEEEAIALYRIAQEAVTNVLRHARAANAWVSLRLDGEGVRLEIRDDGQGLDANGPPSRSSLGVMGMRERAKALGGAFAIEAGEGGGTVVRVRFRPMEHSGQQREGA